jgi:hypothetical protein
MTCRPSVRAMRRYARRLFSGHYSISRRLEAQAWIWECRWDKRTCITIIHPDEIAAKCMLQAALGAMASQPSLRDSSVPDARRLRTAIAQAKKARQEVNT